MIALKGAIRDIFLKSPHSSQILLSPVESYKWFESWHSKIIIMIALKGTLRDFFFTISSLHCELSQTRTLKFPKRNCVQITWTHWALITCNECHVLRRDSSAIKFDRAEITFILALFYWLKPLTNEGGEATGAPGENPWRQASENATCILKPENSSPNQDSNLLSSRLGKHHYTTRCPHYILVATLPDIWS